MLYDAKFENELTQYHNNLYYNNTDNTNEKIFRFDSNYICRIHFPNDVTIIHISIVFELVNMNEFIDENIHELLCKNIYLGIDPNYIKLPIISMLMYNIHKHKPGFEIDNNKLRISIFNIDKFLPLRSNLDIEINCKFIDCRDMSVNISTCGDYIENKDHILYFFSRLMYMMESSLDAQIVCNTNCVYSFYMSPLASHRKLNCIYITVIYSENEIDLIDHISFTDYTKTYEMQYIDLHKIYVSDGISVIMIDMIDFDPMIRRGHIIMNNSFFSENIKFNITMIYDEL